MIRFQTSIGTKIEDKTIITATDENSGFVDEDFKLIFMMPSKTNLTQTEYEYLIDKIDQLCGRIKACLPLLAEDVKQNVSNGKESDNSRNNEGPKT